MDNLDKILCYSEIQHSLRMLVYGSFELSNHDSWLNQIEIGYHHLMKSSTFSVVLQPQLWQLS